MRGTSDVGEVYVKSYIGMMSAIPLSLRDRPRCSRVSSVGCNGDIFYQLHIFPIILDVSLSAWRPRVPIKRISARQADDHCWLVAA
jgi:hypothetical protein